MRTGAVQWSFAIGASVLAHLAVAAVLALTLAPDPVPRAPSPQSRLDLSSDPIEQIAARPRDATGDAIGEGRPEAASLPSGVVPSGRATPVAPAGEALASTAAPSIALAGREAAATALPGADLHAQPVTGAIPTPAGPLAAAAPPTAPIATAAAPPSTPVATAQPETAPAPAATPEAQQIAATQAMAPPLAASAPPAQTAATATPEPATVPASALPSAETLASAQPPAERAPAATLPATAGAPAVLPRPERLATTPADAVAVTSALPEAMAAEPAKPASERLATAMTDAAPVPTSPAETDRVASALPAPELLESTATDAASAPSAMPAGDRLDAAPATPERLATAPTEPVAVAAASPDTAAAHPATPVSERVPSAATDVAPTPSTTPATDRLATTAPPGAQLPAAATDAPVAAASVPTPDRLAGTPAGAPPLPATATHAQTAPVAVPATERLASAASDTAPLPTTWPEGLAQLAPSPPAPDSVAVSPLHDFTLIAAAGPATGERAQAALAWTGEGEGPIDPVPLAAIQSFMQPADLARLTPGEDAVRDGISALLASVPCARMQTVFLPETGVLELRGHIPEEGLRNPVLAALQAQVGGAIPVADNLRVLPRPQCDVLTGIAALGLPQSTVQETDPRLVGPDAHAREYHYREGERLSFEVTTPDYPAHVYIDYYDAEGMVLHLQPNELLDITLMEPKSTLEAGMDPMTGESVFDIMVAPPFGNEIAVAFAASTPIHDTPRPVREPAGPYLDWLRTRIAEAREADPDFRGEWVYFFMSTAARTD